PLTKPLRLAGTIPGMKMSETRELHNRRARARLTRALPEIFPAAVLGHALARRWAPPMPRLAIDSYWRGPPRPPPPPARAPPRARKLERRAGRLDLADWRQGLANKLSRAARAVPRAALCARTGLLLRLRSAGVPLRLAPRPVGRRAQRPRAMAHRLRHGVAAV